MMVYRNDDPPEVDETCMVCGVANLDNCLCHECPVCHCAGDPKCYDSENCGLVRTQEQIDSYAKAEKEWIEQSKAEAVIDCRIFRDESFQISSKTTRIKTW